MPSCYTNHRTGRLFGAASFCPPTHLIDSVIILRASLMFSSVCCTHVCGMRVPMVVILNLKDKGSKALTPAVGDKAVVAGMPGCIDSVCVSTSSASSCSQVQVGSYQCSSCKQAAEPCATVPWLSRSDARLPTHTTAKAGTNCMSITSQLSCQCAATSCTWLPFTLSAHPLPQYYPSYFPPRFLRNEPHLSWPYPCSCFTVPRPSLLRSPCPAGLTPVSLCSAPGAAPVVLQPLSSAAPCPQRWTLGPAA